MGEYSNFKPGDDWGHSSDDEEGEFLHAAPAGYGPSVPPGYPHGYVDEPSMGYEGWTPRRDWARGAREHFDESTTDTLQFQYDTDPSSPAVFVPEYLQGGSPYERMGYMHRARIHGDELEGEP